MVAVQDPARARQRIEDQLGRIPWLRGTGPNPFEYNRWDARTLEVLTAVYGSESDELARYYQAAGRRGRLPGVRGQAENMTLNIRGPWGILERLNRAETLLRELASRLS